MVILFFKIIKESHQDSTTICIVDSTDKQANTFMIKDLFFDYL